MELHKVYLLSFETNGKKDTLIIIKKMLVTKT